jgi:hypothetical protein
VSLEDEKKTDLQQILLGRERDIITRDEERFQNGEINTKNYVDLIHKQARSH